jgi:hypothetical protein
MRATPRHKSIFERLLSEWWVDAAVALFVIGMLAVNAFS